MSFNAIFQPKYHGRCPKRQNCLDALHHYVSQCAVKCGKKFNLEKLATLLAGEAINLKFLGRRNH